jgi:hypothetical protein
MKRFSLGWSGLIGASIAVLLASGLAGPVEATDCAPVSASREWKPAASPRSNPAPASVSPDDYRDRLLPSPAGWAYLPRWCVWIEPVTSTGPEGVWQQRWHQAVDAALRQWQQELPIQRVEQSERAQVRLLRRRPPLLREAGRLRASHGRAQLTPMEVERQGVWRLEPHVDVLISPGQRPAALQATAFHELGHAFGLWGHSDNPRDAMAAVPGATPVLELTSRDRATLRWLYAQPTPFGQPLP